MVAKRSRREILRARVQINLVAVVGRTDGDQRAKEWMRRIFGLDLDELVRQKSPFVASGTKDEMCDRLASLRGRLGTSYVTLAEDRMEAFAPVVESLSGH